MSGTRTSTAVIDTAHATAVKDLRRILATSQFLSDEPWLTDLTPEELDTVAELFLASHEAVSDVLGKYQKALAAAR